MGKKSAHTDHHAVKKIGLPKDLIGRRALHFKLHVLYTGLLAACRKGLEQILHHGVRLFLLCRDTGFGKTHRSQWHCADRPLDALGIQHHQSLQHGVVMFGQPAGVIRGRVRVGGLVEANENPIDHDKLGRARLRYKKHKIRPNTILYLANTLSPTS